MSIASIHPRPFAIGIPTVYPQQMEARNGTLMTSQKRIRFECFLTVGHAGVYFEYQCRPQAQFELDREGLKTTRVFADRVEQSLRSPEMLAELNGVSIEEAIEAVRSKILLLEREPQSVFDLRVGNVSFSGQTDTNMWRRLA